MSTLIEFFENLAQWHNTIEQGLSSREIVGQKYINWKVPVSRQIIYDNDKDELFRRRFVTSIIETLKITKKYCDKNNIDCIVTAIINDPELFSSEICLFFDKDYWNSFNDKSQTYHKWQKLSNERDILSELSIIDNMLNAIGYEYKILDEDFIEEGELWIIGINLLTL